MTRQRRPSDNGRTNGSREEYIHGATGADTTNRLIGRQQHRMSLYRSHLIAILKIARTKKLAMKDEQVVEAAEACIAQFDEEDGK